MTQTAALGGRDSAERSNNVTPWSVGPHALRAASGPLGWHDARPLVLEVSATRCRAISLPRFGRRVRPELIEYDRPSTWYDTIGERRGNPFREYGWVPPEGRLAFLTERYANDECPAWGATSLWNANRTDGRATYAAAEQMCDLVGGQLCSADEIVSGCAYGTGYALDLQRLDADPMH